MRILTPPGANTKLGMKVVSWSRPVGPSCPTNCVFLTGVLPNGDRLPSTNLCYALRASDASPSIKAAWSRNYNVEDWGAWSRQLQAELEDAARAGYAVRGHVGGDFLMAKMDTPRILDRSYLAAVIRAIYRASPRPAIWFYTHAWRKLAPHLKYFQRLGVEVFASVHSDEEAWDANHLGYRLAIDGGERPEGGGPAWVRHWFYYESHHGLACPEQRLGHEKIDCSICGYCFKPQPKHPGNVIFYRHGPGTKTPKTGARHVES